MLITTDKNHVCFACTQIQAAGSSMSVKSQTYNGKRIRRYVCLECLDYMVHNLEKCFDFNSGTFRDGCVKKAKARRCYNY